MADDYHVKREDTKTSRKKLDRNAEYDKENRTIVACKISNKKANAFKKACKENNRTPNDVLSKAIDQFMADVGGWEEWIEEPSEKKEATT